MDYTIFALESMLEDQKVFQQLEAKRLVEESEFIRECLDLGYIVSTEALDMTPVTEGIKDTLIQFFDKIARFFRSRSVKLSEKYVSWIEAKQDDIIKNCPNATAKAYYPLWKGDAGDSTRVIKSAISSAFKNYKAGKYQDFKFATPFMTVEEANDDGTFNNELAADRIKMYCRFGKGIKTYPDKIEMTGKSLAPLVKNLINFCINYKDQAPKYIDEIKTIVANNVNSIKEPDEAKSTTTKPENIAKGTPVAASLDPTQWLDVEQRFVCESDLVVLANYVPITEYDGDTAVVKNNTGGSTLSGDAKKNEPKKPDSNKKDDKKDDKKDEPSNKELTKGTPTEKPEEQGDKPDPKAQAKEYLTAVKDFSKLAVTALETSLEERFMLYVDILISIGDGSGKNPRFKDGKYIDDTNDDSKKPTETKSEKKSGFRNFFSKNKDKA